MEWINLKNQQPEKEGLYLIFAPSADVKMPLIITAWWDFLNEQWTAIPSVWAKGATHWMPLPEPPKEPSK